MRARSLCARGIIEAYKHTARLVAVAQRESLPVRGSWPYSHAYTLVLPAVLALGGRSDGTKEGGGGVNRSGRRRTGGSPNALRQGARGITERPRAVPTVRGTFYYFNCDHFLLLRL